MNKNDLLLFFEKDALTRDKWRRINKTYHRLVHKYISFYIPKNSNILEIGCSTGELLASLNPNYGVGIDCSSASIELAKKKFPSLNFHHEDIEDISSELTIKKFDYILISDVVGNLWDVHKAFENIKLFCHERTRIILTYHNHLWEPILRLSANFGFKNVTPHQNWLTSNDILSFLSLSEYDVIKTDKKILLPKNIPFVSYLFNVLLSNLPLLRRLNLLNLIVFRLKISSNKEFSASIIIPAKNERGNIEDVIRRTPNFAKDIEFIFVEGNSDDNTWEEIQRVKNRYADYRIVSVKQIGVGKGDAVRQGFDLASNDVLMILDADLTSPPEQLPIFYELIKFNKGEFINGCRLVYPMEKEAMRFLNLIANKIFGFTFSYLL